MARSMARAAAMQMIYEQLLGGQGGEETLNMVWELLPQQEANVISQDDRDYTANVVDGTIGHLAEIDEWIGRYSKDWSLERIARVDLSILRLAVYEMLYREDVPGNVAVSEAVELANQYSEPANSRFINGVLGSVFRGLKEA